jgi:hypothetical protein
LFKDLKTIKKEPLKISELPSLEILVWIRALGRVTVWFMRMTSRPFFLRQPVDLVIVPFDGALEDGFCKVIGNDYFEEEDEYDNDEVERFRSANEALWWLEQNRYAALNAGQQDGVFRSLVAVELFAKFFNAKPIVHIRMPRTSPLTPVEHAVFDMLSA